MTSTYYEEYWSSTGWPQGIPRGRFPGELRGMFSRYVDGTSRVLDAGCGNGAKYGTWLAARCGSYMGVDLSPRAVEDARSRGLDARVVADLTSLNIEDAAVDVCVCIEVLEHLLFPDRAAREIHRVLKPGGVLIATVPNIVYWRHRLDYALLGRWHPGGHPSGAVFPWRDPHLRFFTRRTLARMLADAGFAVETVTGIDGCLLGDLPYIARRFGTVRVSRPFRFLQNLAPSLFGANLAVVARRPEE